jgi:hypothetical protein
MTPQNDEGKHARDCKKSVTTNPYPVNSYYHSQWNAGYIAEDRRIKREMALRQAFVERVKSLAVGVCTCFVIANALTAAIAWAAGVGM